LSRRLAATLLAAGCALAPAAAGEPGTMEWAVAVLPGGQEFMLEVARDGMSQARGYMFREHVGPREGMLFVYEDTGRHSIWMKNCKVPLDVVWLDASYRVVHLASLAPCPPEGYCPGTLPPTPSRYVLEFAAGTVREQGLEIGDAVVVVESGAR
jgi:uncharacterized membrane protein (UPF0127 family)